jgi:hypothetical protein
MALVSPALVSLVQILALSLAPPASTTRKFDRRALLFSPVAIATAAALQPRPAAAASALPTSYKDERYGVSFLLPEGYVMKPQELADGRRLVTATDPNDDTTNVFIAFTPIRPDYSSLGSFGTIDFVGSTLLPQCGSNGACAFASGDDIEGVMLEQASVKGSFVYDYTIQQQGGPMRHLRSLFAIKADGAASVLITLTAQCLEPKHAAVAATFKAIIESYAS